MSDQTGRVLIAIRDERERQDSKWGEQNHPDDRPGAWWLGRGDSAAAQRRCDEFGVVSESLAKARCGMEFSRDAGAWPDILVEEVAEAVATAHDPVKLRAELVQVAAVAVAWIEAIDRREVPK